MAAQPLLMVDPVAEARRDRCPPSGRHRGPARTPSAWTLASPGQTLIVDRNDPPTDAPRTVHQAIHDAFEVAARRLKKAKDIQRGDVKPRSLPPHGRVTALLQDETGVRYGFLESRDGRRVYFHEEALVEVDYESLEIGDEVRFAAAEGHDGLQASTVAPIHPEEVGPVQEKELPLHPRGS